MEERLKFYETGAAPRKNIDVMEEVARHLKAGQDAMDEDDDAAAKKKKKKDKKRKSVDVEPEDEKVRVNVCSTRYYMVCIHTVEAEAYIFALFNGIQAAKKSAKKAKKEKAPEVLETPKKSSEEATPSKEKVCIITLCYSLHILCFSDNSHVYTCSPRRNLQRRNPRKKKRRRRNKD